MKTWLLILAFAISGAAFADDKKLGEGKSGVSPGCDDVESISMAAAANQGQKEPKKDDKKDKGKNCLVDKSGSCIPGTER